MLDFIQHHGLPLLFVVVMLESFGLPLPGETALILFGVLASKAWFDEAAFDLDLQRVKAYYADHGYFDARVLSHQVQHVKKDAVDVTLHFALEDAGAPGGLFNCGPGKARTWLDLTRAVFAAMGREPKIEFIEMPKDLQGKYQYFTEATTEKLRAAGYERPFTSLEDGVRDYVQGYLEKRDA